MAQVVRNRPLMHFMAALSARSARRHFLPFLLLGLIATAAGGCATFKKHMPLPDTFHTDVSKQRRVRKEAIVDNFDMQRNLAQVQSAEARREQGDLTGARHDLLAVLQRDPAQPAALRMLEEMDASDQGESEMAQLEQTAEDSAWLTVADRSPSKPPNQQVRVNNTAAVMQVAAWAFATGDDDRAVAQLITFAGDGRRSEEQLQQAAALALRSDALPLAVQLAGDALQRYPRSAGLYRIRGAAEYRLGDYQSAQSSLRQAVSLDNSHPLAYFLLGLTCERLGESNEAAQHLQQAAAIDPRYARR